MLLPGTKDLKEFADRLGGRTSLFFVYMHFAQDLCVSLLVPLLPFIRTDFGLSYLQSGLLLSAYNVVTGLSQFLGGSLGNRFGLLLVCAVGLGGSGLGVLAAGLSSTYYLLLVLLIIMGIFAGGYHPTSNAMLSIYFEQGKRGKVVGIHMVGGTTALIMAPVLGGLIADKLNWHFAFIILSLPSIIAAWLVFPVLKRAAQAAPANSIESTPAGAKGGSQSKGIPGMLSAWQDWRPVIAVIALTVLSQVTAQAATAYLPMYFVDKTKTAAVDAAIFLGILRLGGLPGGFFGGWLADKWGGRNAVVLALTATGPVLYLITRLPVGAFLMLALVTFGAILIVRQAAVQTFLMDNTPLQIRSTVFGIYFGLSHEGSSIAQPVVGYFMDIFGIDAVFNFVALASVALSLAVPLLLRPKRQKLAAV